MPKNAASAAAEYATTHGIKLLRVEAGMRQDALLLLEDLQSELTKIIASGKGSALKTQKYSMMLNEATATIDQTYKVLGNNHVRKLEQLVGIEWDAANAMINKSVGVELVTGSIPTKLLEAAVNGPVILGHSSKEWWAGQSSDLRRQFTAQMGMGALLGESVPDLVKRIQGAGIIIKPPPGSPPGIMKAARRNAEALVRSSVQSTSNHARLESFKAKPNIVKGIQWLATLDSRTTIICMALDGLQWRLPDYEPVGHAKAFPGATAHWGCRSTIISVLYSWEELSGKKLPELNQKDIEDYIQDKLKDAGKNTDQVRAAKAYTRASMDGQVAKAMTFEDWAASKGKAFVERAVGPGRAELYNSGAITLVDLTDQFSRPLTLNQLAKSVSTGESPPETLGVQFTKAVANALEPKTEREAAIFDLATKTAEGIALSPKEKKAKALLFGKDEDSLTFARYFEAERKRVAEERAVSTKDLIERAKELPMRKHDHQFIDLINPDHLAPGDPTREELDHALRTIGRVHGDGVLDKIRIDTKPMSAYAQVFLKQGGVEKIELDPSRPRKAFSLIHEIGHIIDWQTLGTKGYSFASEVPGMKPAVAALTDAIQKSAGYKRAKALERGIKKGDPLKKHKEYLARDHEIFARAYSQYISLKTGDPLLMRQLSADKRDLFGGDSYWTTDEFSAIFEAFDELIKENAW